MDLNSPRDDIDHMMDNMAKSDKISFVSLSDVAIKDYFDVNNTVMWIQSLYQQQSHSLVMYIMKPFMRVPQSLLYLQKLMRKDQSGIYKRKRHCS